MNTLFDEFPIQQKGRQSDEYYTPKWIFDALNIRFDLDVCAPEIGPLHTPTDRWYSLKDDGLNSDWFGRVWMNPPFSKSTPWVNRWLNHANGVCLVPSAKSAWFERLWDSEAIGCLLPTNLRFITAAGTERSIFIQCSIWAIGEECTESLRNAGFGRVR